MTLTNVSVWIRNATENNGSSVPSTLTLRLYATDGNNKPTGTNLLTLINNQSIGAWGDGWVSSGAVNFSLSSNKTYAVVMLGSSGGTLGWKYQNTNSPTSSISPTPTFYNWRSTDSGATWADAAPTTGFNMLVNATPAPIPEPGTWAAAALLVGAAGYVRWRRRVKS